MHAAIQDEFLKGPNGEKRRDRKEEKEQEEQEDWGIECCLSTWWWWVWPKARERGCLTDVDVWMED